MSCQISGTKVNQKEYLRKYLSGGKSKKKKREKDKKKIKATVRIIDDDAQLNTNTLSIDEELLLMGEDAPQIVGTWVEEEPVIRSAPKWKSIVKSEIKTEPEDDDLWGKNETQLQENCEKSIKNSVENTFVAVRRKSSDSDLSPIRARAIQDIDNSPPRKKYKERDLTRKRDGYFCRRQSSDGSDQSPLRKKYDIPRSGDSSRRTKKHEKVQHYSRRVNEEKFRRRKEDDQSPPPKKYDHASRRRNVDCDISPDRFSSDLSPARKKKSHKSSIDDQSPVRKTSEKYSKQSPHRQDSGRNSKHMREEFSPPVRIKVEKLSPDLSPQRKANPVQQSSPNRVHIKKEPLSLNSIAHTTKRYRSPPKRNQHRHREVVKSVSPPPTHKPKPSKTLAGKRAGLQDAKALEEEIEECRRKEDKFFAKMSTDISGRDAQIQVRNTGRSGQWRGREIEQEDPEAVRQKEEHERKRKEKYDRWGKGLKQIEDYRAKVADDIYEASKPLARYADDEDLDRLLREKEHPDDPMLEYMRKKKQEQQKDIKIEEKPIYKGPFPPNRFNIRPGYRWDGVDRSNGFEKKWFDAESAKIAIRAEAYKYSVEDM